MKPATRKEVYRLQRAAEEAALRVIEREARAILARKPNLDEFIMCMGSAFFTLKTGENRHAYEIRGAKRLDDFLNYCDDAFKIMGYAMRFTADGPVRRDW